MSISIGNLLLLLLLLLLFVCFFFFFFFFFFGIVSLSFLITTTIVSTTTIKIKQQNKIHTYKIFKKVKNKCKKIITKIAKHNSNYYYIILKKHQHQQIKGFFNHTD